MSECEICHKMLNLNINFSNIFKINQPLICERCQKELEKVESGCQICGKKTTDLICPDCQYWEKHSIIIKNHSIYYYNEIAKNIINQAKFTGNCKILNIFKNDIKQFVYKNLSNEYFTIPVPLHKERLQERGFNQSMVIANMIPLKKMDILEKINNDKQSKKTRQERLTLNNFQMNKECELANKKLIIVDDIYTTGSTIHHIAEVLQTKKPKEIISFTLFRS